ncbi:MAG: acetylglutamate kinase [Cyclobacteriaceae bacterium]|jgi:acetylglutamate kinase
MKSIQIIKIGGNIIDNPEALAKFLRNFAKVDGLKVLVHGGGKIASEISAKLGIPINMVNGRRVTDEATIKIVTGVYAGQINKNIVADLQALNCNALGLTGADMNIIPAHKRVNAEIDYGFVGDFDTDDINIDLLSKIIEMGVTPVFCALTHDQKGNMLNTNADTIASGLAVALSKTFDSQLTYCFDKKGVLKDVNDDDSVIEHIDQKYYTELKQSGAIHDGMIPKLDNSFNAIENGVSKIVIKHADYILENKGTTLTN